MLCDNHEKCNYRDTYIVIVEKMITTNFLFSIIVNFRGLPQAVKLTIFIVKVAIYQ